MRKKAKLQVIILLLFCLLAFSLCGCKAVSNGSTDPNKQTSSLAAQQPTEHLIDVPFHYQDKDYYCGPACLEMVFDYYGQDINQSEIADVARTVGEPYSVTYAEDMLRAAYFSNLSTSKGNELPERITGYSERDSGLFAFEAYDLSLAQLRSYVDQGKPLIVLTWYSFSHVSTHYRVVVGYNETHVFVHDPWNKQEWGGLYGGPYVAFSNSAFLDLWSYYSDWALCILPWSANVSSPVFVRSNVPFQVSFTVASPTPVPSYFTDYTASSCNATVTLPESMSLVRGEEQKKALDINSLPPGTSSTVSWDLTANVTGPQLVRLDVEGLVFGSMEEEPNSSAYTYTDRIGTSVNLTLDIREDNDPPVLESAYRTPEAEVQPLQEVHVSVNATDLESGISNVTLYYSLNNGSTWNPLTMDYNLTSGLYATTIPGQPEGTYMEYKMTAYDNAGNLATMPTTLYFNYNVIPEYSDIVLAILLLFTPLTILAMSRRSRTLKRQGKTDT